MITLEAESGTGKLFRVRAMTGRRPDSASFKRRFIMLSEEQWQSIGDCEKCGAPMFFKEGEPIKVMLPAPDCTCYIKEIKEEKDV